MSYVRYMKALRFVLVRLKVLVLCTGNSCRSQMAEAFARQYGGDVAEVHSAGITALGHIPADTVDYMAEKGIGLDGQRSKGLESVPCARWNSSST